MRLFALDSIYCSHKGDPPVSHALSVTRFRHFSASLHGMETADQIQGETAKMKLNRIRQHPLHRHAVLLTCGAIAAAALGGILFSCSKTPPAITFKPEAYVTEAGRPYSLGAMVDKVNVSGTGVISCTDDVDTSIAGTYHGACVYLDKRADIEIRVVDTTAPELIVQNVQAGIDEEVDAQSFIVECSDISKYAVQIQNASSLVNRAGKRKVRIEAIDEFGNSTVKTATLTRSKDFDRARPLESHPDEALSTSSSSVSERNSANEVVQ